MNKVAMMFTGFFGRSKNILPGHLYSHYIPNCTVIQKIFCREKKKNVSPGLSSYVSTGVIPFQELTL